jgi:hypothetical protein
MFGDRYVQTEIPVRAHPASIVYSPVVAARCALLRRERASALDRFVAADDGKQSALGPRPLNRLRYRTVPDRATLFR